MAVRPASPAWEALPAVSEPSELRQARAIARLLDSGARIPGTGIRFGLDPILGLVPGVGDLAGAALSGFVVMQGARLGAPRSVVARMLANLAIDTLVGAVPVLGDVFDVGWKANTRNVALLERHLERPASTRASSVAMLGAVALALLLLALGGLALTVVIIRALIP